mmetsp:Transcript_58779/g.70091  ORF Transcript_58779/g.70091 Transcript_58779/m.70091 type:complete len:197 (+) Transcript_58779:48-638(+)|eukprot:CAMPEP_0172515844 /NCGR_PEP_ID=MMETSP1066-20121228/271243_1 /TAXON_ID=671091 /ORGANISM="Coscinodiscus wailesii, Strain CCMP2513" /LENGTH=196 /DNA_ID=CAMNT_0013297057 /DNA_START=45 /DNA_END=635 /DNA_ORIENTATION=+
MRIIYLILPSTISAFSFGEISSIFTPQQQTRTTLKNELISLSRTTKRGLSADDAQKEQITTLFDKLERLNPTPNPLKNPKVNGDWSLEYTTSDSILGRGGFPRVGPIVQTIDAPNGRAENSEVVSYFGVPVPRKVTARLAPRSSRLTDVQFERFSVGPVGFDAPESFKGYLDITYLDDDFRLARGDKGNIFVLTRM